MAWIKRILIKMYLIITLISVLMIIYQIMTNKNPASLFKMQFKTHKRKHVKNMLRLNKHVKFILIWTRIDHLWKILKYGQIAFVNNSCAYNNCFITDDKSLLLNDYRNFEAILFDGTALSFAYNRIHLPIRRFLEQKYIFVSAESARRFPICDEYFDGYFNYTFTYRLDSDIVWEYFTIFDLNGTAVGPKKDMKWISKMNRGVDTVLDDVIKTKTLAVAWIVSNCNSESKRENFAKELQYHLKHYNLTLDIVGRCGTFDCPIADHDKCLSILQNYYFYLSFENSFDEDYVTEKVLNAVLYDTVPIVYGGANYSRFIPPDSYLDARKLGVVATAAEIDRLIKNMTEYISYFRWRNHYSYKQSARSVCALCELVNKGVGLSKTDRYRHLRQWWNPLYKESC